LLICFVSTVSLRPQPNAGIIASWEPWVSSHEASSLPLQLLTPAKRSGLQSCRVEELSRPALSRATASLEVRREGLRLVSPSRAPHGKKVRCIISHQSQPPRHNQWSRLVYLFCVPFWNTGPYSLVSPHLLVQCRSRNNGVSTATSRETSKPYVYRHIYLCEHACKYIIIVCTHIFIGACIHVVRYRQCDM
jgi:hypothetical protein